MEILFQELLRTLLSETGSRKFSTSPPSFERKRKFPLLRFIFSQEKEGQKFQFLGQTGSRNFSSSSPPFGKKMKIFPLPLYFLSEKRVANFFFWDIRVQKNFLSRITTTIPPLHIWKRIILPVSRVFFLSEHFQEYRVRA